MKSNFKLAITVILGLCLLVSCSQAGRVLVVKIPVKNPLIPDFSRYSAILFFDRGVEKAAGDFDPKPIIKEFFLVDLARSLQKEIKEADAPFPANPAGQYPGTLLLSSRVIVDIKSRSIIKDMKKESGKKGGGFVSIESWDVTLEVVMADGDTGETVFQKKYSAGRKEADPQRWEFHFKSLFSELTDRLATEISLRKERLEERFLLLKDN